MTVNVSPVSRRYWLAIPEDERARIEAAVPPGHRLIVKPGWRAKPGTTDVSLRDESNDAVGQDRRGTDIAWMCWAVLNDERVAREYGLTLRDVQVVTDGEGYVRSIEATDG